MGLMLGQYALFPAQSSATAHSSSRHMHGATRRKMHSHGPPSRPPSRQPLPEEYMQVRQVPPPRCRYLTKMQAAPTVRQMMNSPSASGRPGISPASGVKRTNAQLIWRARRAATSVLTQRTRGLQAHQLAWRTRRGNEMYEGGECRKE